MATEATNPKLELDLDETGDWLAESVKSTEFDDTGGWTSQVIGAGATPVTPPSTSSRADATPPSASSTARLPPTTSPDSIVKTDAAKTDTVKTAAAKSATTTEPVAKTAKTAKKTEQKKEQKSEPKSAPEQKKAKSGKPGKPPKRPLWRGRIIPKTVLGISFTMMVAGLAMAASGTLLFMNYRYQQDQSNAYIKNFPLQVRAAQRAVANEGINARAQVQQELDPLRKLAATTETLDTVLGKVSKSIWGVRTFDVDGQPTAGTAFVVASDDQKTFLLTSYSVIAAATVKPGPKLTVTQGQTELDATLWTWQEDHDLALLIIQKGSLTPLSWAAPDATRRGDQLFSVSGIGSEGGAIFEGRVGNVASSGILHNVPMGTAFRGGPLLDDQARVVAVSSRRYSPLGFVSEGAFYAPSIQSSCDVVLECAGGRVKGAGAQR
jgi:Trypsin-like peptidase domain